MYLFSTYNMHQSFSRGYKHPPNKTPDSPVRDQHPSPRASEPIYVPDSSRRGQHISYKRSEPISLPESGRYRDLSTDSTCSLEEAAEMAFTTEGTLLHINTGHIYWSERRQQHAEKIFVRTTSIPASNIRSIWIKNSPCADCSSLLINHFSMTDMKPTIYIGKIWDGDDSNNRQGLRNMIIEGFVLKVWDTPRNKNIEHTQDYLDKLLRVLVKFIKHKN